MLRYVLLASAFALSPAALAPVGPVAPTDDTLDLRLERLVRAFAADDDVAGVSAVVQIGDDVLYSSGSGYADPAERLVAEPDSPYRAGALTPTFVALLLADLAEDGELDLDAPVARYLGETADDDAEPAERSGAWKEHGDVTVAQLLAHTSGLPGYAVPLAGKEASPDAVLAWLADEPPLAEPGTCAAYSETNELLAGLVLERVAGRTVKELVLARVVRALGLEDTTYCWEGPALHEHEPELREHRGELVELPRRKPPFDAEGLCTSARDLARFQRALATGDVVSRAALDRALKPARVDGASETAFGLGLDLGRLDDRPRTSFGGGGAGSRVHVAYFPEAELTIALLEHGSQPLEPLADALARAVLDVPDDVLVDLALEPDLAGRYLGEYLAGCVHLAVEFDGVHLVLRPWTGSTRTLLRQDENVFAAEDDARVRVTFLVEDDEVVALELDDHGTVLEARRQ